MTIKQKFLWKEGEIRFYRQTYIISDEQYQRADKALDEVILHMKVRLRRRPLAKIRARGRFGYRSRRPYQIKETVSGLNTNFKGKIR